MWICLFVCGCGPKAKTLHEYYAQYERKYLNMETVGSIAFSFDLKHGKEIYALVPGDRATRAERHVKFLDTEKDNKLRRIGRCALASTADAKRILESRAWTQLSLTGKREIASMFGSAPSIAVADIVKQSDGLRDPVCLLALMMKTAHAFGAPPEFLLKDKMTVPSDVVQHWNDWLRTEWPNRAKLTHLQRGLKELEEIRESWKTATTDAEREKLWAQFTAADNVAFAGYRRQLEAPKKLWDRAVVNARGVFSGSTPTFDSN